MFPIVAVGAVLSWLLSGCNDKKVVPLTKDGPGSKDEYKMVQPDPWGKYHVGSKY